MQDCGGSLDVGEFSAVLKKLTPDIQEADVETSFKQVGAEAGVINVVGLAKWVRMMFSEESQQDFEAGMNQLLEGDIPTLAPGITDQSWVSLIGREVLARKLFETFDADKSGFMDLQEFTALFQVCKIPN